MTCIKPINSRYEGQIVMFGTQFQDSSYRVWFLEVQVRKEPSINGVSCGRERMLIVAYPNVVVNKQLSKQFLYRGCNIGQLKSKIVASATSLTNIFYLMWILCTNIRLVVAFGRVS